MISSDQETTFELGAAPRVQEVGHVTIEPMHELTSAPPSPSRMSLYPCLGEHAPSGSGEANEAASRAADGGPTTVQGDGHETDKGPEQYEGVALGIVGDEDPSAVEGGELILGEEPVGHVEDVSDKGLSTSTGGGPNADEVPEQHEAVTPEAAHVTGNEGLSTEGREEDDLGEHSGTAALSGMTKGARDDGPNTIRGEIVEESSGADFELAPPEVTIDMAIVPSWVTPPAEVTLVTAASTVTAAAEVAPVPVSYLIVA
ncbi:hypothetical protein AMTR_s00031p00058290 [Amborella trichopoda]|uniref:Uncharacterized protein n=1 Tax=Amborella trichopoda TaxID=13333 RepID=U5D7Z5_AMBTC|nr:hypothetical protein AMTR_s00031p00058290 [Amborella trichopoda]